MRGSLILKLNKPGYYECENDDDVEAVESAYNELLNGEEDGTLTKSNYVEDALGLSSSIYEDADSVGTSGNYEGYEGGEIKTTYGADLGASAYGAASGNYEDTGAEGYDGVTAGYDGGAGYAEGGGGTGYEPGNNRPPKRPVEAVVADTARDWHGEFIAVLSAPASNAFETLRRYLHFQAVFQAFAEEAVAHAKVIVHELHKQPHTKTIKSIDAGGVAGGVKYLHRRIFFKFTLDQEGLYSGDEFAAKAAGRELAGLESYFSFILEKGSALKTAMQMLIDYGGYRLIACSLLPIGSTTLVYGSNDAGRTVHADCLPLNNMLKQAGKWLNLKPHIVAGTEIYGPADIEGHVGKDGNYYVLDTARIFPPEQPPRYFQGLIVPPSGFVRCIHLPTAGFEPTVKEVVGAAADAALATESFVLGTMYFLRSPNGAPNPRCERLCGRPTFGDTVIVPNGYKGKFLYNLLRREFVQTYTVPLSSDAFSGFGRHNFKEHNDEVAAATMTLRTKVLSRFLKDIKLGLVRIADGGELTSIMHERGLNMRLLGLVWARCKIDAVKEIVLAEMVTRAAKQLMRMIMRLSRSEAQLKAAVLRHLNLLLGNPDVQECREFWDLTMQTSLRSKYGSYAGVFGEGEQFFVQEHTNMRLLFQRLTALLGLRFAPDVDVTQVPFARDLDFKVDARTKSLIGNKVKNAFANALKEGLALETLLDLERLCSGSTEKAVVSAQIAQSLFFNGQVDEARARLQDIVHMPEPISLELRVASALLLSKCLALQSSEESLQQQLALLTCAQNALNDCRWSGPLSAIVADGLCQIYTKLGGFEVQAKEQAFRFKKLWRPLCVDLTPSENLHIFGCAQPISFEYVGWTDMKKRTPLLLQTWLDAAAGLARALTLLDTTISCGPFKDNSGSVLQRDAPPFALDAAYDPSSQNVIETRANGRLLVRRECALKGRFFSASILWNGISSGDRGVLLKEHERFGPFCSPQVNQFAKNGVFVATGERSDCVEFCAVAPTWSEAGEAGGLVSILVHRGLCDGAGGFGDADFTRVLGEPHRLPPFLSRPFVDVVFTESGFVAIEPGGVLVQGSLNEAGLFASNKILMAASVKAASVAGGNKWWAVVSDKNELFTWGTEGSAFQLGHGDGAPHALPRPVAVGQPIVQAAACDSSSAQFMAVRSKGGEIFCWGSLNEKKVLNFPLKLQCECASIDVAAGAFGITAVGADGLCFVLSQLDSGLIVLEELQGIPCVQTACGDAAALFLSLDGRVYCIGLNTPQNALGRCGVDRLPASMPGGSRCALARDLLVTQIDEPIVRVYASETMCAALSESGNLFLWGEKLPVVQRVPGGQFCRVLSLGGAVVAKLASADDPVPSRATLPASHIQPSDGPFFSIQRVVDAVVVDMDPTVFILGESVKFDLSLPRYCRNSEFTVSFGGERTFTVKVESKERPCIARVEVGPLAFGFVEGVKYNVTLHHKNCPDTPLASTQLTMVSVLSLKPTDMGVEVLWRNFGKQDRRFQAIVMVRKVSHVSQFEVQFEDASGRSTAPTIVHSGTNQIEMKSNLLGAYTMSLWFAKTENRKFAERIKLGDVGQLTMVDGPNRWGDDVNPKAIQLFQAASDAIIGGAKGLCTLRAKENYVLFSPGSSVGVELHVEFDVSALSPEQLKGLDVSALFFALSPYPCVEPILCIKPLESFGTVTPAELTAHSTSVAASLTHLYALVYNCRLHCVWAMLAIPIVRSDKEESALCRSLGIPEPVRVATNMKCALVDPDLYYVHPMQQVAISWEIDKTVGMANTHMIYAYLEGVRNPQELKTCAQLNDCPTTMYIPQLPVDTVLELIPGYMDSKLYTYVWGEPVPVCIASDDRDARQKNRKRQIERGPKTETATVAGPSQPEEADLDAIAVVVEQIMPTASQPEMRKLLLETGLGRDVALATYGNLRACGLSAENAGRVFAAIQALQERELKKLTWQTALSDVPGVTVDVALAIEGLIPLNRMQLLDAQMLTDAGLAPKFHARLLDKVQQLRRKFLI